MRLKSSKQIYQFDNVFNETECNEIINKCETIGFTDIQTNKIGEQFYNTEIRNDQCCALDNHRVFVILMRKLQGLSFTTQYFTINRIFRVSKYSNGGYCKPHTDGIFSKDDRINLFTVLLYLNTPTGGETVFHDVFGEIHVAPKTGTIVVFDPSITHESLICKNIKYCLRTDIMIKNPTLMDNDPWYVD
jgi:predicted 2-oxoglutarate/Fe(II)-dependent dioxygenase YbiX